MEPILTPEMAVAFSLILSRVIGIFMGIPFLNTSFVPLNVRILLVIALSFFFTKINGLTFPVEKFSLIFFFFLVLKEVIIGFLLGVVVSIFIAVFSYAAEIISYFMGLTIVNVFDPSFGQIAVLDRYFIALFYLLFFITDAYQIFLGSILKSFEVIPLNTPINFEAFVYVLSKLPVIFFLGFKMAFPFALIMLIINVALALVNRLIPQINVFIVGLPLQIFVGLASLSIGAAALIYFGVHVLESMTDSYLKTIEILGK